MKIRWLSFLVLNMLALNGHGEEDTLTFNNFSQKVTLTKGYEDFWIAPNGTPVRLSDELVITTDSTISLKTIKTITDVYTTTDSATTLYEGAYNFYRVQVTRGVSLQHAIDELTAIPAVINVQPDLEQMLDHANVSVQKPVRNPTYIDALGLQDYWQTTRGSGVQIAIIDDGFNLQHPDLRDTQLILEYNAETESLASGSYDEDRHGTRVAGVIFSSHQQRGLNGIAPEAALIAIRQPSAWTSKILIGFQVARLAGADVINCSWNSQWLLEPVARVITDAAKNGRNGLGIAVVFAAGNQGRKIAPNSIEASVDAAIVVGSGSINDGPAAFSNYGPSIDLFAFGGPQISTSSDGHYDFFAGTSLSSAIISGYIALLISETPSITLQQINDRLREY